MKFNFYLFPFIILFLLPLGVVAQPDETKTGAWYMYFWNTTVKESTLGFQGDIQFRNWNVIGDLEQLLLRGGITYKPKDANVKFTLGYGHITTGQYGDSKITVQESRIYQEALIPNKVGKRVYLKHRFRYEQRFVENQDTRTRFRYNLFMNIPLNQLDMGKGAIYLALYNELFVNGEREIGTGSTVELYDRNRFYAALGFKVANNSQIQFGFMQQKTNSWSKGQLQLSLHQTL